MTGAEATALIPRDEWPLWARTIARLATPDDRGVGDTIARTIGPVRGDARQEQLNVLYAY